MKKQKQPQKHDLKFKDISKLDVQIIKGMAIQKLIDTKVDSNVEAIIEVFLGYLHKEGYKITKVEE